MHLFRISWESRPSSSPQNGIFGFDRETDLNTIDELCGALSLAPLSDRDALQAALVLHYLFAAGAGASYAIFKSWLRLSTGRGILLFGTALWLLADECAVSLTGLSNPVRKSPSSHVSALFAHLFFTAVSDLTSTAVSQTL